MTGKDLELLQHNGEGNENWYFKQELLSLWLFYEQSLYKQYP